MDSTYPPPSIKEMEAMTEEQLNELLARARADENGRLCIEIFGLKDARKQGR